MRSYSYTIAKIYAFAGLCKLFRVFLIGKGKGYKIITYICRKNNAHYCNACACFYYVQSAWKALQSEATVTGYEVPGEAIRRRCAWNFRASERRAELVRAMPSAAENLEEVALRHRTGIKNRHWGVRFPER